MTTALPFFRERSEQIIKALITDQPADGKPADLDLVSALERICTIHGQGRNPRRRKGAAARGNGLIFELCLPGAVP